MSACEPRQNAAFNEVLNPLETLENGEIRPKEDPVFGEPWQARAFAMTVQLHANGLFSWREWADTLSETIRSAQLEGDPDLGDNYYHHWLKALERIVTAKNIASGEKLVARKDEWERAAHATPHGEPIELLGEPQKEAGA